VSYFHPCFSCSAFTRKFPLYVPFIIAVNYFSPYITFWDCSLIKVKG